jgi:hypothetical protein
MSQCWSLVTLALLLNLAHEIEDGQRGSHVKAAVRSCVDHERSGTKLRIQGTVAA